MRKPIIFLAALILALLVVTNLDAQLGLSPTTFSPGQTISSATFTQLMTNISSKALNRTGGTMTGALLFSADNTHDIGASGATRPRDLHLSRNALVGGTLGVTGASTFAALSATTGTFSGAVSATGFTGSGASLTGIPETAITDGALLARLAAAETVTGSWTFAASPVISVAGALLKINNTSATIDNRAWFWRTLGDTLNLTACNDATSVCNEVLTVSRSGAVPTEVQFETVVAIDADSAHLQITNTAATANNREWFWRSIGDTMNLTACNDAISSCGEAISVTRSGAVPQTVTVSAGLTGTGAVAFSGTQSLSTVVANNDIALNTDTVLLRVTTTVVGTNVITGFANGVAGRSLEVCKVAGSEALTFSPNDANSAAANQIANTSTLNFASNVRCATFRYDGVSLRWRITASGA